MKGKNIAHWVTTGIIVLLVLSGGLMQDAVAGIVRLGSRDDVELGRQRRRPLVFAGLAIASWALHPDTRRLRARAI